MATEQEFPVGLCHTVEGRRVIGRAADPAWRAYLAEAGARDLLVAMENRIVTPTAFSPVQRVAHPG